jgi:ABC-type multidrug transport system fused ATPase/permease subunit
MKGEVTVVMIAHRLSTVRNADQIVYMESGEIKAVGTFLELRKTLPDFDRQAKLMGL